MVMMIGFLPSKQELELMYSNLYKNGLGSFDNTSNSYYWTSSQYNIGLMPDQKKKLAWTKFFMDASNDGLSKDYLYHVRAIRVYSK